MPSPDLSVVVPTFNQADLLDHCLESLTRQTMDPRSYEIVVADDGSTDHTQGVVRKWAGSSAVPVRPVPLPQNRGRSAARNVGTRAAASPLIVFVDSDVVVAADFLHWHLVTHRQHGPGIVCRGPVVLVTDPAVVPRRVWGMATSPAFLDTANASLERTALAAAGWFDESFPGYGWEDFEMGLRLKSLGIRRVFCRRAVAYHVQQPMAAESLPALLRKEDVRALSAAHFLRQHPTRETRFLIQATPMHRVLYWIASAGGRLRPEAALRLGRRLESYGAAHLAHVAVRAALNWHYSNRLREELARGA